MKLRTYIISLALLLAPYTLLSQPGFSTITDETSIHQNGILQVQYIIENATRIENFQAPAFHNFIVLQGPMETTGMSLTNNQLTEYKALTYILRPTRKGRLTVSGATAVIDGKKMVSNKVVIEVAEAASIPRNPFPRNPGISELQEAAAEDFLLGEKENASEKIKNNLLVKLELDKTTAFIGEPIVATYKLYTRLRSSSSVSKRPSMNGFSVYDMEEPGNQQASVEKINGKPFMVHIIRKTQLIPLQEGRFTLEPVELDNTVRFLRSGAATRPSANSPLEKMFDNIFPESSDEWEEHHVTLASQPREITIRPLPAGAPASFTGAVGDFSIRGKLLDTVVTTGENARYELIIDGKGNLPLVNPPGWQTLPGFEQFDPVIKELVDKTVAPMRGTKTITYSFSSSTPGESILPPLSFSYFDPPSRTYKTLSTQAQKLKVITGMVKRSNTMPADTPAKIANSFHYFWLLIIAAFGILVLAIVYFLLWKKRNKVPVAENAGQPPAAPVVDPLSIARLSLERGDTGNFYKAVETALWEAIAKKLPLTASEKQKKIVIKQLAHRGMPGYALQELQDCWDACDWALYVPVKNEKSDQFLLQKAGRAIQAIGELA